MEKTESAAEYGDLKPILFNLVQKKMSHGKHKNNILITLQAVMEFGQNIIENLESSGQSPKVACGSGCSYCCHSLVRIIPAEALLIASFIRLNYLLKDVLILKKRINHAKVLTRNKTIKQKFLTKNQTPCIFLDNNICSIYPVRPLICRAWNSLNQTDCKKAFFQGNHNTEIEVSPARNFIFGTAREIFQDMDKKMALETSLYEIPGAILDCLNQPDSLGLWCSGQHIFNK